MWLVGALRSGSRTPRSERWAAQALEPALQAVSVRFLTFGVVAPFLLEVCGGSRPIWCQEVAADSGNGLDEVPASGYGVLPEFVCQSSLIVDSCFSEVNLIRVLV